MISFFSIPKVHFYYIKKGILMNWQQSIMAARDIVLGWPVLLYVIGAGFICTVLLRGVQIRWFVQAWKSLLFPSKEKETTGAHDMTPIQAFINTLSTNIGNGSLAGMATAVYAGGPGAIFWVIVFGCLLMAVRFAEVYLSTIYGARQKGNNTLLGGPMLYIQDVIGGKQLSYMYAVCCVFFGLIVGNAVQANSISLSIVTTWQSIPLLAIAVVMFSAMLYIVCGGSARIVMVSDRIVPLKVGLFFVSSFVLLGYHFYAIPQAIALIIASAFSMQSVVGGVLGFSIKQAVQFGMSRSVGATESGLGTAAILFGFTGSRDPKHDALMGMLSAFVSTCVCVLLGLCLVVSGVWSSGLNSTALTIAAYATLYGAWAGYLVTFLSITFGLGVAVSYAYIVRAAWLYVTGGRFQNLFVIAYAVCSFFGAVCEANLIWALGDFASAAMLVINLFAVVTLLIKNRAALQKTSAA